MLLLFHGGELERDVRDGDVDVLLGQVVSTEALSAMGNNPDLQFRQYAFVRAAKALNGLRRVKPLRESLAPFVPVAAALAEERDRAYI